MYGNVPARNRRGPRAMEARVAYSTGPGNRYAFRPTSAFLRGGPSVTIFPLSSIDARSDHRRSLRRKKMRWRARQKSKRDGSRMHQKSKIACIKTLCLSQKKVRRAKSTQKGVRRTVGKRASPRSDKRLATTHRLHLAHRHGGPGWGQGSHRIHSTSSRPVRRESRRPVLRLALRPVPRRSRKGTRTAPPRRPAIAYTSGYAV